MRALRLVLAAGALLALPWTVTLDSGAPSAAPVVALAAPEGAPAGDAPAVPDLNVKIEQGEKHVVWFANPVLIAAGLAAAVVIIALIAMASRGGGTTIVER